MTITEFYQQFYWLIWYLLAINVITIFIYGLDKAKSGINIARRVSERALLVFAFIGGSVGALIGMKLFRHKTQKLSFQAPLAVVIGLQILLIWFVFFKK